VPLPQLGDYAKRDSASQTILIIFRVERRPADAPDCEFIADRQALGERAPEAGGRSFHAEPTGA